MNRSRILEELRKTKQLRAECPRCGGEFLLSKATMFDGAAAPPGNAALVIRERQEAQRQRAVELRAEAAQLRLRKHSATEGARRKSFEVNLGKVVEKIVTGWEGFPHEPLDCRPLFEPIDYIAFDGMTSAARVDGLTFLDVKTGDARLNAHQRLVKQAVVDGRVEYREV